MSEPILDTKVMLQVAILVKDIEKAAKKYAEMFGVPVPAISTSAGYDQAQTEYFGERCDATCKMAFINFDNITLEIIQPDGQKGIWTDMLEECGEGFHHIAFSVKGMKNQVQRLVDAGIPLIQKGEYTGGRYAFLDTRKEFGMVFELLENDNQ